MSGDRARTVLITGCSSGIGRATAAAFLDAGWVVYATARDPTDCAALADRGAATPPLDVTDPDAVAGVVERVERESGGLDCLVNCAGVGYYGPLADLPTETLREGFEVNVFGVHRLARAFVPLLREEAGTIVTISSVAGRVPFPGAGGYAASKAAVESLSDALRAEVTPLDVDVTLVEPGPVDTDFARRRREAMADLERSDGYDWVYDLHDGNGGSTRDWLLGVSSPGDVATRVLEVATSDDPPARVAVGRRVWLLLVLSRLVPESWRDVVYRRLF